jgi:raffinose/stachyose/melibiose transport system permease protein
MRAKRISYFFILPALLFYLTFFVYPTIQSFYYAFTDWDGIRTTVTFIGLDNFKSLLDNSRFIASFKNTIFVGIFLSLGITLFGLIFALLLNQSIKFRNFYRMVFFAPQVISLLAIGYLWSYILSPINGLLNVFLGFIGMDFLQNNWLGDFHLALKSVTGVYIWQGAGYAMIVFLANLQSIPKELFESCEIDGANRWQAFRKVTFPLLAPATTISLVIGMIAGLRVFDIIISLTKGGPGYATDSITTVIFANVTQYRYGEATAMGIVMFVFILLVSIIQLKFLQKREMNIQ